MVREPIACELMNHHCFRPQGSVLSLPLAVFFHDFVTLSSSMSLFLQPTRHSLLLSLLLSSLFLCCGLARHSDSASCTCCRNTMVLANNHRPRDGGSQGPKLVLLVLMIVAAYCMLFGVPFYSASPAVDVANASTIYAFNVIDINGRTHRLSQYDNQVGIQT
jgi:hypothetical protein